MLKLLNKHMESNQEFYIERPHDRLIIVKRTEEQPVDHSLVFVHGLMDTSDHILKEIQSGVFPFPEKGNFRILLPNAPVRYITKLDKTGPSWYDMNHLEFTDPARYNND